MAKQNKTKQNKMKQKIYEKDKSTKLCTTQQQQ
jgi:hypothetical protein